MQPILPVPPKTSASVAEKTRREGRFTLRLSVVREGRYVILAIRDPENRRLTLTGVARSVAPIGVAIAAAVGSDEDTELEFQVRAELEIQPK